MVRRTTCRWPAAEAIARFRANPVVREVHRVSQEMTRQPDGSFSLEGTHVGTDQLRLLMLDARLFEDRNEPHSIALETMDVVMATELRRQGREDLAVTWNEVRGWHKRDRNQWWEKKKSTAADTLMPSDLVRLEFYGNTYHLDYDKALLYQELTDAGAGLLIHQAVLWHLLLLAKEVRALLGLLDRFEEAGASWSPT